MLLPVSWAHPVEPRRVAAEEVVGAAAPISLTKTYEAKGGRSF